MARIRTIKPSFWTNGDLVQLPYEARLLFIGIWNHADDSGFIEYDPEQIRIRVLASDPVDASELIDLLVAAGKLEAYTAKDGSPLLHVAKWEEHQRISNPTRSHLEAGARKRRAIPAEARRRLALKSGAKPGDQRTPATCYYCGMPGSIFWPTLASGKPSAWVAFSDLHIDHFESVAGGGDQSDPDNYVLACSTCNCGKKAAHGDDFVAQRVDLQGFREHSGTATQSVHTEGRKGKERKGKESHTPVRSAGAVGAGERETISGVFTAWRDLFGRNSNTKLDDKRKARIRWALREYGKATVWQVLRGYASDPWRHESTSKNEIRTLLRDAAAIDRGLELYAKSQGAGPSSAAPKVDELTKAGY